MVFYCMSYISMKFYQNPCSSYCVKAQTSVSLVGQDRGSGVMIVRRSWMGGGYRGEGRAPAQDAPACSGAPVSLAPNHPARLPRNPLHARACFQL